MKEALIVKLVLAFVKAIAPMVGVYDGVNTRILDYKGTLATWMQLPDSSYSPMFVGWLIAYGYDTNSFNAVELAHAVQVALVGENKNVIFDWEGDSHATKKPH